MNRWNAFVQLFLSRLREFYREPEVLFWVYGFPVIMAVGLGVAFSSKEPEPPIIDVQGAPEHSDVAALRKLLGKDSLKVEVHDELSSQKRLRDGKTMLVLIPDGQSYRCVHDPRRPESLSARYQVEATLLRARAPTSAPLLEPVVIDEVGNRYIDFLLPGLMGMSLMGGGLWGVGFVVVDMRIRKLLKRFLATPMRRDDFLLSVLCGRLIFMFPEMVLLLLVGYFGFSVPLRGNPVTLTVVILLGALAFSGVGLFVACRATKLETISGLMNLVMLPMWLLSGTFFSAERFPDVTQPFIQALPLTILNNALRAVMLEGASFLDIGWQLVALAAWAVIPFAVGLRWFRWQ